MNLILKPIVFGTVTVLAYLLVVIITTPALPAVYSIQAAFGLNSAVIIGMGVGIGLQVYLSEKSKSLGCKLNTNKALGGNSGSTAATSFFSFFSLVPLGCCGWWLYILSLLPSVLGTGVSAILIQYSQPLSYLGLAVIFGLNGLAAYRLRRQITLQKLESLK